MKMLTLCLTVILITTFTSLLFSENTPQLQIEGMNVTLDLPTKGNIFYNDPDNNILLIDFKEVNNKLSSIKVTQAEEIVMEDRVGDLAEDSIYEVDLSAFGKGAYTVTLVTIAKEEINEQIIIK